MDGGCQGFPGFVHRFLILCLWQDALAYAPCHAIEEETGTCHLRTTVVGWAEKTDVPISIFTLTFQEGLTHSDEVFLEDSIVLVVFRQGFHDTYQGGIYPTVSTAPVAVAAIFLLVRWYVVLVTPPQTFFFIEKTACKCVTAPLIGVHGIVEILAFACEFGVFGIDRHCHLDGIDPCPVRHSIGAHLMVKIGFYLAQVLLATCLYITVDVGLLTALVVGIGIVHTVASCPFVIVSPSVGVVEVTLLWVNLIECHQALVIYGTSPEVAGTYFLHIGVDGRIAVLRHKVVVGAMCHLQDFVLQCVLGRQASQAANRA